MVVVKKKHPRRNLHLKVYKRIPKKWKTWLQIIQSEIGDLIQQKTVILEVKEIIEKNPLINQHNLFYDYLFRSTAMALALGLRRVADEDRRTLSLFRLLLEIKHNNKLLSRRRYVALYGNDPLSRQSGHNDFDRHVGRGRQYLSKNTVTGDITKLKQGIKLIKKYVDKYIAHTDRRKLRVKPMYADVYNALDIVEKITIKYSLLLYAQGWGQLTPVIQYNWKKIFETPWLRGTSDGE